MVFKMKYLFVILGVFLACGTAHAAPQVFDGHFDGGDGHLTLNERTASLAMDKSSCAEEITDVRYVKRGNIVVLLKPSDDTDASCHMILTVRGNTIISSYETKCMSQQSNSCDFNITFH